MARDMTLLPFFLFAICVDLDLFIKPTIEMIEIEYWKRFHPCIEMYNFYKFSIYVFVKFYLTKSLCHQMICY